MQQVAIRGIADVPAEVQTYVTDPDNQHGPLR
jgi:hypothetical protein